MLASVLNSAIAVRSSVYVVRAFVKMRTCLAEYAGLAHRLEAVTWIPGGGPTRQENMRMQPNDVDRQVGRLSMKSIA